MSANSPKDADMVRARTTTSNGQHEESRRGRQSAWLTEVEPIDRNTR